MYQFKTYKVTIPEIDPNDVAIYSARFKGAVKYLAYENIIEYHPEIKLDQIRVERSSMYDFYLEEDVDEGEWHEMNGCIGWINYDKPSYKNAWGILDTKY